MTLLPLMLRQMVHRRSYLQVIQFVLNIGYLLTLIRHPYSTPHVASSISRYVPSSYSCASLDRGNLLTQCRVFLANPVPYGVTVNLLTYVI
jgi:hypothetical protein